MFYWGDLGKIYKEESLISFTLVPVTLSIARNPKCLSPWETSVCHVEGFSPQKTRLDKHQRQLDSILPGLECPRGQELFISLMTHFKSTASPPLPSPSLSTPFGLLARRPVSEKCTFDSPCSILQFSPTVSLGSRVLVGDASSLQLIHYCLWMRFSCFLHFPSVTMESHYLWFRSHHGKGEQISSSKGEGKENSQWFVERGVRRMQRKKNRILPKCQEQPHRAHLSGPLRVKSQTVSPAINWTRQPEVPSYLLPLTQVMFALKDVSSKCYYYILYCYYINSELIKKASAQCDMILSQQIRYHPFTHVHPQSYCGYL